MIRLVRQNYRENARLFSKIKRQLMDVLGDRVAIEHVGSMAIKGIVGKNIVDVLVGVSKNEKIENVAKKIDAMGYIRGTSHPSGAYIFFASRSGETSSGDIHIHLVAKGSRRFRDFLVIKQYLINKPKVAKEYSASKHELAKQANYDRKQYKALKEKYVNRLMTEARKYYG